MPNSYSGDAVLSPGDLGILLDDINPLAIPSLLAPRLAGVPIARSLIIVMLASPMAASVDYLDILPVRIVADRNEHGPANDSEADEFNWSVAA